MHPLLCVFKLRKGWILGQSQNMYSWLRKKKGANEKSNIFLMGVMGRLAATRTSQKAARLGSNQEEATLDSKLLQKQQTKEPFAKSKIQLKQDQE